MNEMKQRWLLLFVQPYRIVDERSGQINEGVSALYLPTDSLQSRADGTSKGLRPAKCVLPTDKLDKIIAAPAFYDFTLDIKIASDMKAQISVKDLDFACMAEMKAVAASQSSK